MRKLLTGALSALGLEQITPDTPEETKPTPSQAPKKPQNAQSKTNGSDQRPTPEVGRTSVRPVQPQNTQRKSTHISQVSTPQVIESDPNISPVTPPENRSKKANGIKRQEFTQQVREQMMDFSGNILTSSSCPDNYGINSSSGSKETAIHCLLTDNGILLVDASNLVNAETQLWIRRANSANIPIRAIYATPLEAIRHIHEHYADKIRKASGPYVQTRVANAVDDDSKSKKDAFVIINAAYKEKCTDIHFDTEDKEGFIWFRINGLLIHHKTLPREAMLTLLKTLYSVTQGATSSIYTPKEALDGVTIDQEDPKVNHLLDKNVTRLRCQFRPVGDNGGALVIRINKRDQSANLTLRQIGYAPFQREIIQVAMESPQGLIWITGPTGCGKSMTAKTVLEDKTDQFTEERRLAIMTIEDPREYQFRNHIQSTSIPASKTAEEHKAKFSTMIAVLLRSNPNINFLGEARTKEVLELTYQSAETGHLTLSTLHVNNVHAIYMRERGMGMPDYYVYSTDIKRAAIAQRLIPKLCPHCALTWDDPEAKLSERTRTAITKLCSNHPGLEKVIRLKNPKGCESCNPKKSGQNGIVAVCEVLEADEKYVYLQKNEGESAARNYWKEHLNGMSFEEHAIYKVLRGIADPDDIVRQTGIISRITTPERIAKIIDLCSNGTETPESLISAGPVPQGEMFSPI